MLSALIFWLPVVLLVIPMILTFERARERGVLKPSKLAVLVALGLFAAAVSWMIFYGDIERTWIKRAIVSWGNAQSRPVTWSRSHSRRWNVDRYFDVTYQDGDRSKHCVVQVGHWFWGYWSDEVHEVDLKR